MEESFVILADENDNQTGVIGKMEAHRNAFLHRPVSVFIVNSKGEWILQRRAFSFEVGERKGVTFSDLKNDIQTNPANYTYWF